MFSSPSASPVSAGSDNSTECFRDAVSQQLSVEGQQIDRFLIPSEALAYNPKPSDILKVRANRHLDADVRCILYRSGPDKLL